MCNICTTLCVCVYIYTVYIDIDTVYIDKYITPLCFQQISFINLDFITNLKTWQTNSDLGDIWHSIALYGQTFGRKQVSGSM